MKQKDCKVEKNAGKRKTEKYSVHTFEGCIELDPRQIRVYKRKLEHHFKYSPGRTKERNKWYKEWNENPKRTGYCEQFTCYDNQELFEQGVSNVCIEEIKYAERMTHEVWCQRCFLVFQVNPRRLLGEKDYLYICIAPVARLPEVLPVLCEKLELYGINKVDSSRMKIRRLDYCSNIQLESQEAAERYLKLLRKGGYYRGYNYKYRMYDMRQKRMVYPWNEVRYQNAAPAARRREELSIYLKYPQIKKSGKNCDREELEAAKGQIRIEQRVWRAKLNYLETKYEYESLEEFFEASHEIGAEMLETYLYALYGTGKFVRYKKAIEKIRASNHRLAVKERMEWVINQTKKEDFGEACKGLDSNKKSELKKYFNELGISPITLRDSWEEEEFENPVTYIQTQNVNER